MIISSKSSECTLLESMITSSWKILLPDLYFFKEGPIFFFGGVGVGVGGGTLAFTRSTSFLQLWCTLTWCTMTLSTSCSTLKHCLLYNTPYNLVYVWANIEKFWSQPNFSENPWIYLCHFAQQDVAKSVCLHNGTSPQDEQQKGALLSSFFHFFPCLTFSSNHFLQQVRTLTYRSPVLAKCLETKKMKSKSYLLSFPLCSPISWVACLVKKIFALGVQIVVTFLSNSTNSFEW